MKKDKLLRQIFSLMLSVSLLFSTMGTGIVAMAEDDIVISEEAIEEIPSAQPEEVSEEEVAEETVTEEEVLPEENLPELTYAEASSAEELEDALFGGAEEILITSDFEIDRTFYIANSTKIYTNEAHTLTRAKDFSGDMFVIGEDIDGLECVERISVTFGEPYSDAENMLVIDGNKDNMEATVSGTAIFIANNAQVSIYKNVTIRNCEKKANERTLDAKYSLTGESNIGGAAVIFTSGELNIYGASFIGNAVNNEGITDEEKVSIRGGAIYSFGALNISGAKFYDNYAARGGALYNYRTTHIVDTEFKNNTAGTRGGAIYIPDNELCVLYLGGEAVNEKVVFDSNSAQSGGAIYAQGISEYINTEFKNNSASSTGGAIYATRKAGEKDTLTITNSVFSENTAGTTGGAILVTDNATLKAYGTDFVKNTSTGNGGALYISEGAATYFEDCDFEQNKTYATNYGGGAMYLTGGTAELSDVCFTANTSDYNAGALATYSASSVTGTNVVFTGNTSQNAGGAIYSSKSTHNWYNTSFVENSSSAEKNAGGAVYLHSSSTMKGENLIFTKNTVIGNGGAVFLDGGSNADLNGVTAEQNSADLGGGFLYITGAGNIVLNKLTAKLNTAGVNGGAALVSEGSAKIYNSEFSNNTADANGGAVATSTSGQVQIYNTSFKKNSAAGNAGAVYAYSKALENILHTCTFEENTSEKLGGVIYTSNTCVLKIYNATAKNNSASKGGFLYETTTGTTVTLSGTTVSGNTATEGGNIIWGNSKGAVLYINKTNFTDLDKTGSLDDVYWSEAIINLLTVYDVIVSIPEYTDYGEEPGEDDDDTSDVTISVKSAQELEDALKLGFKNILISADFEIERTFYITADAKIYTEEAHTLTRAKDFAGDIFVVGADKNKVPCAETVTLTLGDSSSNEENLLIIDGNKDNMEATVSGTALFVVNNAKADIYKNVTIRNCEKKANERTLDEAYDIYTPKLVGGAAVILASGELNIYGASFIGNKVNDEGITDTEDASIRGGAIYSYGTLNINGAKFYDNYAARGGAIYNYRTSHIVGTEFKNNSAGTRGGAIYIPDNELCVLYLGGENAEDKVVFDSNSAQSGGAIYAQGISEYINTEFKNNSASSTGGAIYATRKAGEKDTLTITNSVFSENTAGTTGGAILVTDNATFKAYGTDFVKNTSTGNGGALYISEGAATYFEDCDFEQNKTYATNYGGGAMYLTGGTAELSDVRFTANTSDYNAGAIGLYSASTLTATDTVFKGNTAKNSGGAIYSSKSTLNFHTSVFEENEAYADKYSGGAVYVNSSSTLEMYSIDFIKNTVPGSGGAVYIDGGSSAILNEITANENKAGINGGFLLNKGSTLNMYNSLLTNNEATSNGGAVCYEGASVSNIYKTTFRGNAAGNNAGAVYVFSQATESTQHTCTFEENTAVNYGGAMYASNTSVLKAYNITAKNNSAGKGGFLYETTTGTTITLNGTTVSGNTAKDGGNTIWGNSNGAVLYINKTNFTDLDKTGSLDDAYWAEAIVNKLKVNEINEEIPKCPDYGNESYDEFEGVVDVASSAGLEKAIKDGFKNIRITKSFAIDRTFYITGETVIFSTAKRTLTRAPGFSGDIFVVGEDALGNSTIIGGKAAKLTLGNPNSDTEELLVIDGNSENMTVDVVGTVLFLSQNSQIDIHKNVSIVNNRKVGNERALLTKYDFSSANRVGGAAMIISDGTVNIYGATFKNNICNDEIIEEGATESHSDSSLGGAVYNRGTFNIHSGNFMKNQSARGGFIYNLRAIKIHSANFVENHATKYGGAIYLAGTQFSQLYAGDESSTKASETILFNANTSESNGGAIYCSTMASAVIYGDATFKENKSSSSGGAITSYGVLTARNTSFKNNEAYSMGGAVYIANASEELETRIVSLTKCAFEDNIARNGGAVAVYATNSSLTEGGIAEITNCSFKHNKAVNTTDAEVTSNVFGGAIFNARNGALTIKDSGFEENEALFEGGAIYASGGSTTTVTNSSFTRNKTSLETDSKGGVASVHSATLNFDGVTFAENETAKNGGAIYVSYTTASSVNSDVNIANSTFDKNKAGNAGGALYITKHKVETEEDETVNIKNTTFNENSAFLGGAMYLTSYSDAYMKDVVFNKNAATGNDDEKAYGGALYITSSAMAEIDGAEFVENISSYSAGAIALTSSARAILNNIKGTSSTVPVSAGFMYINSARVDMYESEIKNNYAQVNGGAVAMYNSAVLNANNTVFEGNAADGNGGAIYEYATEAESILNKCTFTNNTSSNFGGAVYVSNAAILYMYNTVAENNSALKGGFMYETTTATEVTINGLEVNGNTATEAGHIIFGNTTKAILNIHKANYTDAERNDTNDDEYWDYAIKNLLTVNDISDIEEEIPESDTYEPRLDEEEEEEEKPVVPVTDVLNLGLESSDGTINSVYTKLPVLDKSSNFMSKNTTVFDDINGGTVTVDSFICHQDDKMDNCTVGEGILLYQAILYKQAHPDEEVNISVASFRFSALAAVNINRNSRYFGYMRNLVGADYDKFGFVRLSYLMVTAAKMGINITVVGQLDGYPQPATEPTFDEYFESFMEYPCDPDYVADGKVKDYLNFVRCDWTSYDNKAATDMMHTKMCAVSHYLDMNGVVHKNGVWSSSSNLDGINSNATNGNNKMQTATIVSDHEEIYLASRNYIEFVSKYCGQEDVYIFRDVLGEKTKNQIDLIEAGRAGEISKDEMLVYLGSENDDVFELYFSPFAGDVMGWTESYNPYCKYIRKFSNSDDYITLIWNSANYSRTTPIVVQMEELINDTFDKNRHPENAIYINLDGYDTSVFDDMVIGEDIGHTSFNEYELGQLHSKDLQLSYSENGKRQYVSILSSINMHGGAMSYQSNFVLIVKEDNCKEDSVYFTFADNTSKGMVFHNYGEIKTYIPETKEDGYIYKECEECGIQEIYDVVHRESEWVTQKDATVNTKGISYTYCEGCGIIIKAKETSGKETDFEEVEGRYFTNNISSLVSVSANSMPHTFEAVIKLSASHNGRGGVIIGNYKLGVPNVVSFEIYDGGRPRLYYKVNSKIYDCIFDTDIRSDKETHVAVSVDGLSAKLYVDGELKEEKTLEVPLPDAYEDLKVGGDNRLGNVQYFKGQIYSYAMFYDARSEEEIKCDRVLVSDDAENLIKSEYFIEEKEEVKETKIESAELGAKTFSASEKNQIGNLTATPHTFEAIIRVPEDYSQRAGVIVGNYSNGNTPQVAIEIYDAGKPRLFYSTGTTRVDCMFNTDIRSSEPVHVAITIDDLTAKLYVDGELKETKTVSVGIPEITENYKVGGDNRSGNAQYFKGDIYALALFSDVRTEEEIIKDKSIVTPENDNLLYSGYFLGSEFAAVNGASFTNEDLKDIKTLEKVPYTFEAIVNMPKTVTGRGGVIAGNYKSGATNSISFEIHTNGRPRLYYRNGKNVGDCIFDTDIRSDKPEHIVITVDGINALLYVNGELKETKELSVELPAVFDDFKLGGDNRFNNAQHFKGTIYALNLFSDVRTEEEIKKGIYANKEDVIYHNLIKTVSSGVSGEIEGKVFSEDVHSMLELDIDSIPHTYEATIQLSKDVYGRAGTILGNYAIGAKNVLNLEVYEEGKPRLYYKVGSVAYECIFDKDIRSDEKVHIAVVVDGLVAILYVNGVAVDAKDLARALPGSVTDMKIGGDNRSGNARYFRGTIYNMALFSDTRSADEVKNDVKSVSPNEDNLLYNINFSSVICPLSPIGSGHIESDWIIDKVATVEEKGYKHKECMVCGNVIVTNEFIGEEKNELVDYLLSSGLTLESEKDAYKVDNFTSAPKTFEALISLPKTFTDRAGVVVGNYDGKTGEQINIEIYTNGKPRLYYKTARVAYTYNFTTDIRSDSMTHLAITVDGLQAKLYVNGTLKETVAITKELANATNNFSVGADNRTTSVQYFKGTIHAVSVFSDVRTAEEINQDRIFVTKDTDNLLFTKYFGIE